MTGVQTCALPISLSRPVPVFISFLSVVAFTFVEAGQTFLFDQVDSFIEIILLLGFCQVVRLFSVPVHADDLESACGRDGDCICQHVLVRRIGNKPFEDVGFCKIECPRACFQFDLFAR